MNEFWRQSREELLGHAGTMEQLAPVRRFVFTEGKAKGVEAVSVETGAGLSLLFLVDRGLDLLDMRWQGRSLGWRSAAEVAAPAYYERRGSGWLRGFAGGMVTTCGLRNVGPGLEEAWETFGLHGEISYTPATNVQVRYAWEADAYRVQVAGQLREAYPFGPHLVVQRTWRTELGAAWVELEDVVTNEGFQPEIHMHLYHCNFGYPLLNERARLCLTTDQVAPRDDAARRGIANWSRFEPPSAAAEEQVFFHSYAENRAERTEALLVADDGERDMAVRLSCPREELPYLVQWKLCRKGDYVLGIEPANCLVEGRQWHQRENRPLLPPGGTARLHLRLEVLSSRESVTNAIQEIESDESPEPA